MTKHLPILSIIILLVSFFSIQKTSCQTISNISKTEQKLIQKLEKSPAYREVVTHYFENYKSPNEYILQFAKKSDGWYVYSVEYGAVLDTLNIEKFWSYKSNKFLKLRDYPSNKSSKEEIEMTDLLFEENDQSLLENVNSFISPFDEREFDLHPCYGYIGWTLDVINLLSKIDLKTDNLNYSLARAYSRYSSSIIRSQYGYENLKYQPAEYEKVDNKRLQEYLLWANKAIDAFYKVYQINPQFETIVGDIYTKYCNEKLFVYHNLLSIKEEDLAKTFLKDSLYNQQSLAFAKNYLVSCPQNAILITNGDNDTYLPWYLQAKYGIRPDVRVANFQLMMTGWYNDMLRNKYLESEAIEFSFNVDLIKNGQRDIIICVDLDKFDTKDDTDNQIKSIDTSAGSIPQVYFISFKEALKIVFGNDTTDIYKKNYHVIPGKYFYLTINKENLIKSGLYNEIDTVKIVDLLKIGFHNDYLLINSIVLIDLITESDWKRPICFGITNGSETYLSLHNYFMQRGMVYQLTPVKKEYSLSNWILGWVNTEIMYENLLKKFSYPNYYEQEFNIDDYIIGSSQNYRNIFETLASAFLYEGDTLKATEVLDFCEKVIPADKIKHEVHSLEIFQIYYQTGNFEKGDRIADQILTTFSTEIQDYKSQKTMVPLDKERMRISLETISLEGEKYNRSTIKEKANKLLNEINQ